MKKMKSLLCGVAALALAAGAAEAADLERIVADPTYAATISAGWMHTWTDVTFSGFEEGKGDELGTWSTPFGEAAVLWRPAENFNLQSDFAFHSHRFDPAGGKGGGPNIAVDQWHMGGVAFWRDPGLGLFGIDGAVGGIDIGAAADVFRIGARGEWFAGENFTIGGGVGYHNIDFGSGKGEIDGILANAFVNWYITEDLAAKVKFDYADLNFPSGAEVDGEMWAVGGELEYLLRDMLGGNAAVFVGGRYAEQNFSNPNGPESFSLEHAQVFVGFRTYFVTGGSLANHHRTNTLDNTNTLLEKIPFLPIAPIGRMGPVGGPGLVVIE